MECKDGTCSMPAAETSGGCCGGGGVMPPPPRASKSGACCETGTYGDIGKAASDLLSKDFAVGKLTAEVKSRNLSGLTFTASGFHALASGAPSGGCCGGGCAPPGGSVQIDAKPLGGLSAKLKLSEAGVAMVSCDARWSPALKLTMAGSTPPAGAGGCPVASASCGVELSSGPPGLLFPPGVSGLTSGLSAQASYELVTKSATASIVRSAGPLLPLTAALSAGYDAAAGKLVSRGAKLCYALPGSYALTAFGSDLADKGGKTYGLSVHAHAAGGVQVATELSFAEGRKPTLASAICAPVSVGAAAATAKAKVDTNALLSLSLSQRLSPVASVTLAGCVDLNLDPSKTKFGMHLALAQ